ncbi:DUF5659 domain-containing protein [Bacillus sp. JJ1562]|uniref:DUF5659 domain-containing protein n=1 Tax=Bacillus sp. JJ1562 TaxID=3122960 RepID=UPI0030018873
MAQKNKVVLSKRVMEHLTSKGFEVESIEPSRKIPGFNVYVFKYSPELQEEMDSFLKK